LPVIIRGYVVDVDLVAVFDVVEEKVRVRQVENHLLHSESKLDDTVCVLGGIKLEGWNTKGGFLVYLAISGGVRSSEQGVEDDYCLVQVPDEDPLEVALGTRRRVVLPPVAPSARSAAGLSG